MSDTQQHKLSKNFSGKRFVASLPLSLVHNFNISRIFSPSLCHDIVAADYILQTPAILLSQQQLTQLIHETLNEIGDTANLYHNRHHTEQVIQCCKIMAKSTKLPPEDQQLLILAALFHDFGHSGTRLRQYTDHVQRTDISNEEFACIAADERLAKKLSLSQRIELQGLILATSFGQQDPDISNPAEKARIQRNYAPYSKLEHILALADIGRFILGFEAYLDGSLSFLQESNLHSLRFTQWCQNEINFLAYIDKVIDNMARFIEKDYIDQLKIELAEIKSCFEGPAINEKNSDLKTRFLALKYI